MKLDPNKYEHQVAVVKAANQDLICLDAGNLYSLNEDGSEDNLDAFSDATIMVETFAFELNDEKEQERSGEVFNTPTPIIRVSSTRRQIVPDSNTYIIDEFPIREESVIYLMTMYLNINGYFEKNDRFLWGTRIITKEEGMNYGTSN